MAGTLAAAEGEALQSAALFTFFVLFSFTSFTFRGKGQLESPAAGVL